MNLIRIIKDAFLFPSKNAERFAVYLLLSVLMVLFAVGGVFTYSFGIINAENYLIGGIYLIIAMLIGFIIAGYHIKVIKSGIGLDDEVPVFQLYEDFMTGFDYFVVSIFHFIIPALIVALVAYDTNIFGNAMAAFQEVFLQAFNVYIAGSSVNIAVNAISYALTNLVNSLAVTIAVALVLFAIFLIILLIAQARLANTCSLKDGLNIFESLKDIKRIGVGRLILLILLVLAIMVIIEIILVVVFNHFSLLLSVGYIIITPYFVLVIQRALGLLYSDIA